MKYLKKNLPLVLVLLLVLGFAVYFAGRGEKPYPNKPIDTVVPSSAGAGGDVAARIIAKYLGEELGVTVNVINTAGGGGIPAVQSVLEAPADGYTLMSDQGLSSSYQYTLDEVPYDLMEDRTYICKIVGGPQVICGSPNMGWEDITDVADYIRANPDQDFLWGGVGKNSATNFAVLQFLTEEEIDVSKTTELRYAGGGDILAAIAGGHVLIGSCAASGVPSFSQGGLVKPLVVCGSSRLEILPGVPCAAELGYKTVNSDFWIGLSGSSKLPKEVVDKLNEASQNILKNEACLKDLAAVGLVVNYMGPDELDDFILEEAEMVKVFVAMGE